MTNLTIVVDLRCCNEKGISIDGFQNKLKNNLSQFNIKFQVEESASDVICTKGYIMFEIENPSKKDTINVGKVIEDVFNNLIVD